MAKGRSVRLYLVDGTATGILTAEIINWTGHVLVAPRTRLEAVLDRAELRRTGVYMIFGADAEGGDLPSVYVGEGDEIGKRLLSHNRDDTKAFWERFIAITNKDMNLTKAHVRYLEGRLIDMLKAAKKVRLANGAAPSFDRLPEADIADMESFLAEIELVLPVVGIDFPRRPRTAPAPLAEVPQPVEGTAPLFTLTNPKAGIDARALEVDGEFVILAGSTGSLKERPSFHEKLKALCDAAFDSGRAEKMDGGTFTLREDIAFSSPSAAAVFLFGTSRNGRTDWIEAATGQSYGAWKDSVIDAAVSG